MVCYYLRHIDLHAVYEQLPAYQPGGSSLANIPPQLCVFLALYFEELAEIAADGLEGFPDWRDWAPCQIAAEVGDLIESELEGIEMSTSCPAPSAEVGLVPGKVLDSLLCFATEANTIRGADYLALLCLLVYQYDALCSIYAVGDMDSALALFESIAETRETLTHCQELHARDYIRSREAKARAAVRHQETNAHRTEAIEQWNAGGHQFSSMRAFARNRFKEFGVTDYMTVYNWLRQARREAEPRAD